MELRISKEDYLRVTNNCTTLEAWDRFEKEGFVTKTQEEDSNIKLFATLYKATRRQQKHRGINKIQPSKVQLDVCTYEAVSFAHEYNLELRPGIIKFLQIAVKLEVLALHILQYKGEMISNYYQSETELSENKNPKLTDRLIALYRIESLERFGFFNPVTDSKDKVEFVRLALLIRKKGYNPEEFMQGAMEYWSWLSGTMKFSQLRSESMLKELRDVSVSKPIVRVVKLKKGVDRYG